MKRRKPDFYPDIERLLGAAKLVGAVDYVLAGLVVFVTWASANSGGTAEWAVLVGFALQAGAFMFAGRWLRPSQYPACR